MRRLMTGTARLALASITAHAFIVALHAAAHQILGVAATQPQTVFIVVFIMVAPIAAGVLLWRGLDAAGSAVLLVSMTGSLIFGVYYHFVLDSPDHVSHVSAMSPASWASVFQLTALLLALTEALGVYAGLLLLKNGRARR